MAETNQSIDRDAVPALPPGYRMQWEEVQDCHVLLYPEGMVQLSDTASLILQRCDGNATLGGIIAALEQEFDEEDLSEDVLGFMSEAVARGWVRFG